MTDTEKAALAVKEQKLYDIVRGFLPGGIYLAFSGGTDSAVLLKVCLNLQKETGGKVQPVYGYSCLQCETDEEVKAIAARIGAPLEIMPLSREVMEDVLKNPVERCYLCKTHIFTGMKELAEAAGCKTVMDGTNEEDLHKHRPGLKAIAELGVESPFADAGFSKSEVRALGEKLGVAEYNKEADSCIATRVSYKTYIDQDMIDLLKRGEKYLKGRGYTYVRIRMIQFMARIEVKKDEIQRFMDDSDRLVADLRALGFKYLTLDMSGYEESPLEV
ncbi:MAG: ATP-dependent sacrificial sulfur transferase LarE [Clostridia bacterium]|nr:ATP-dependent sacrificial sulfur transferase LarE [Clostridia bacterium]